MCMHLKTWFPNEKANIDRPKDRKIKIIHQSQGLLPADKKVNKELEHLANTINKPDLIKIYKISYPIEYTHRTFTKTDDIPETNFKGLKSYRIYSSNIL